MELSVSKIPEHRPVLIPVASENVNFDLVTGIKFLKCDGVRYSVYDAYSYVIDKEVFPKALFFMALGIEITKEQLKDWYPNSEKVYVFICQKVIEKEVVKQKEYSEVPDLLA